MSITLIYASLRGVIAINGDLPYRLKEDLKFFREYTMGKTVVMGRKTVESLPKKLDGRTVICLTRDTDFSDDRCDLVLHSREDVLEWASENLGGTELVIAGGREVYDLFMEDCDRIVKTRINHTLIPKKEFLKLKDTLQEPDMSVKGEFGAANVLRKTNKMVVVEYVWGGAAYDDSDN